MLEWIIAILIFIVVLSIKIIYQYERGVVFTLGRFSGVLEPGLRFVIPILQEMRKVDMRIMTVDVPKQEIMTKDNVPVGVNAVVYFRVEKPEDVILKIQDYRYAVAQFTLAAMKDAAGNSELDFILTEREQVAENIKRIVDEETATWGVNIESIKIQEIELPIDMKRAMARQAEAEREKRAVIIRAQGELEAADNIAKASEKLAKSPGGLHLRTLEIISDISSDPAAKFIFIPTEVFKALEGFSKTEKSKH